MNQPDNAPTTPPAHEPKKAEYEAPRIIYEGVISTRAGTPGGGSPIFEDPAINPEDLFGE